MKFEWDAWQKQVLEHEGNITIRAGRQVGKSEVISEKAVRFALEKPESVTMIIAASQRQSSLLFEKVRAKIDLIEHDDGKEMYKEKPTLTRIVLANGSKIYSLPAGRTGYFIRGFTIDLLIADEAAYIPETVWTAVIPMIAVSKKMRRLGYIILLSTPFGKGGYFYHSFTNDDFRHFHVSSEKCNRIPKDFLAKERSRLSKHEYKQEYLGEFVDDYYQFFPSEIIKDRMNFIEWSYSSDHRGGRYYLGVDIARYGGDENAFVICEAHKSRYKVVKCLTTERVSTTDTIGRVIALNKKYNFNKIFLDDAGVGGAVTDVLVGRLGRKVLGINNASKRIQVQGDEKNKGILKEDLYSNALMLMETKLVDIISNLELLKSLKSITFEYTETSKVKIYGPNSHLTEAMIRALWCHREKGLGLYFY